MGTVKGQIRVRGTCKAGHVTEATSDKGRVTWEGTCGHDGCDLRVKATRPPRPSTAPSKAGAAPKKAAPARSRKAAAPATPAGPDDPYHVHEVEYEPEPKPRARPAAKPAGEPGGGGGGPAGEGPPARVEEPPVHPATEQRRRGNGRWHRAKPKLTREQRAEARSQRDQDWIVPGVLPR